MKLSYKCITYARVSYLEEALFSFLQQDHSIDQEMIIVNDYPLQELVFDHPKVKIYNLKETFDTIGEKENYAIERCSGDLIVVADDDDIALPWHSNNILKYWKEDTNLLHWNNAIYWNEPNITSIEWIGNSGIVYSKKAWEEIGKSPIMNAGGDSILVQKLHQLGKDKIVFAHPPNEEVSWYYRWAANHNPQKGEIGIYHQSGEGFDTPDKLSIIQRHSQWIEVLRMGGHIPTGRIELKPKWKRDYIQILKNYNNGNSN